MIRILILVLALSSGGLAAWLALVGQAAEGAVAAIAEPAPQMPLQEVLVAASDIGQGATLDQANVRWQQWPEEAIAAGFITRSARPDALESLKEYLVRSSFRIGDPIRDDKLVQPGSNFLSALLPSGKRAVAVRISAENAAGGFVLPNDRVDVIHTFMPQEAAASTSRTILSNVLVIAVDQSATENAEGNSVVGKTATLELEPHQVEIVTAAESSGSLSLALRSVADHDEAPKAEAPKAAKDTGNPTVRVTSGGKVEIVEVKRFVPSGS